MIPIREPAVSGTFYPNNPKVLKEDIRQYLSIVPTGLVPGGVTGLISPHAGYMYSGQVAAYGYKTLTAGTYDTVIVVAPSHRAYFEGAALQDKGGYRTPLGLMPIDEDVARAIVEAGAFVHSDASVHRAEHAIEVQLPFLQVALGEVPFVPLIMGEQGLSLCRKLADQIVTAVKGLNRSALLIGSTDLSHYHPYAQAVRLDNAITSRLRAFDTEGLEDDLRADRAEACGAGPMLVTMLAARKLGADRSAVLKYANSGDVSGDKSAVVGYTSCVFYREGGAR
ncbi:MAG TPA: AmmeMemoRadiSam system protein B [Deltaproteobacteria bacterium]|nr:AmmeMemoRadiSam system protein B [Deltaproteobacteria bacterium]